MHKGICAKKAEKLSCVKASAATFSLLGKCTALKWNENCNMSRARPAADA